MKPRYLKTKANAASVTASQPAADLSAIVKGVIDTIRREGDAAVRHYSEKFDNWAPDSFRLSQDQIDHIISEVPEQTINDIKKVQSNVRKFAEAQKKALTEIEIESEPGVLLGHKNIPIQNVGA